MASPYVRHVHSQEEVTSLLSEQSVVIVDFHAAWSGPCRAIAGFYSQLAARHRAVTFVRLEVDLDSIGSLGQQYRLTELPTFIMAKNADEMDRIRGPNRRGLEDMVVKHAPESEPSASGSGSPDTIHADDTSLLEDLDMAQVNCLNEAQNHPLKSIVEKKTRNTSEAYLESDADEQLLITLPFNQVVRVRSIVLHTKDPKFGPKDIKIDINNLALGFGDVENAAEPAVVQALQVPEDLVKEGKQIQLRFVRLQRVNSLHIFVASNHGNEDVTRIDAIDVYGPSDGQPAATTQMGGLRNFLETHDRGVALLRLFLDRGGIRNLSESVLVLREALLLCPTGNQDRGMILSNLTVALFTQYEQQGGYFDLIEVIPLGYQLLELRPLGHPDRALSLNNLSVTLLTRYEREGSLADLSEAAEFHREALELRPLGHPDRAVSLNNFSSALLARYNREGSLADLSEATEHYREALELNPLGHSDRASSLNNLSNALLARYEREGSLADLSEATEHYREALELRPLGHPHRASSLNSISNALLTRYDREGGLADLSKATEHYREALELHPPGHPDRAKSLNNLSSALLTRYEREGHLTDLSEATERYREALELHPLGHLDRASSLTNLSNALLTRYEREGSLADLSEATGHYREALELHPLGHPAHAARLNNLSNALLTRYEREGSLADLSEATERHREALELLPLGHQHRATSLNNFSNALMARYEREGSLADLSEATEQRRKVLELRPPGHPDRAQSLSSLSTVLLPTIDRASDAADMPGYQALVLEVLEALREAVGLTSCPPRYRLRAALQWIGAARRLDPESTLDAYTAALEQLDIVLATSDTLANKHTELSSSKELDRCRLLGIEAASYAVHQGNLTLAVELLERGRNLLFTQVGRYRADLEDLRKVNVELVDRFSDLSRKLDAAVVSNRPSLEGRTVFEDPTERYRRVASDWSQVVDSIRTVEGFEHFLQSPNYPILRSVAAEGPIIIIIPGPSQSDALVISHDRNEPHHVNLPTVTLVELVELARSLVMAISPGKDGACDERTAKKLVKKVLHTLWDLVVRPIADALEYVLHVPLHSRIWWCPTSALSALPLHAAGRYAPEDPNSNFPAKYVSSYTPTLQALSQARKHNSSRGEKALIIAQPGAAKTESWLPNAQGEAELVKKLVKENLKVDATLLLGEEGTRAAVLEGMVNHSWLHITCHGFQDYSNPFHSCFGLYDVPLTLHDIMQRGLPDATFAFLAACHTATGDVTLLDEGLHLAAGLHFAGFKSVVGTFWEVADIDGPVIAEAFYKALQEEGMDCSKAAYALSKAVQHLRDIGVPVHRWMRFIHIGV